MPTEQCIEVAFEKKNTKAVATKLNFVATAFTIKSNTCLIGLHQLFYQHRN